MKGAPTTATASSKKDEVLPLAGAPGRRFERSSSVIRYKAIAAPGRDRGHKTVYIEGEALRLLPVHRMPGVDCRTMRQ